MPITVYLHFEVRSEYKKHEWLDADAEQVVIIDDDVWLRGEFSVMPSVGDIVSFNLVELKALNDKIVGDELEMAYDGLVDRFIFGHVSKVVEWQKHEDGIYYPHILVK